jgi:hypothetical protein
VFPKTFFVLSCALMVSFIIFPATQYPSPPQGARGSLPKTESFLRQFSTQESNSRCVELKHPPKGCKKRHRHNRNRPPVINSFSASSSTITLGCPPGTFSSTCTPSPNQTVQLTTNATDPDGDTLLYTYTTTGGRLTGDGANVSWDLSGVQPGTYTTTVTVDDGCGCVAFASTTVTLAGCVNCLPPCPMIQISCTPESTTEGNPVKCLANLPGLDPSASPTYSWVVLPGEISSGQNTPSITINTNNSAPSISVTLEVGGLSSACDRNASSNVEITKR